MKIGNCSIQVLTGDITKFQSDAIVNAANPSLMGGGGVDGAIHLNGGPQILEECRQIVAKKGRCPVGEAVITGSGNLPSNFVIHTVGPIWHGGHDNERQLLRNAYTNSLKVADDNNLKSIAFPNISTGVYGFPKELAVLEVKAALEDYLNGLTKIEKLTFICFDDENLNLYREHFT